MIVSYNRLLLKVAYFFGKFANSKEVFKFFTSKLRECEAQSYEERERRKVSASAEVAEVSESAVLWHRITNNLYIEPKYALRLEHGAHLIKNSNVICGLVYYKNGNG